MTTVQDGPGTAYPGSTVTTATTIPTYDDDSAPAVPRTTLGRPSPDESFTRIGSWVGAAGLAWVVSERILPLGGVSWFLISWFVCGVLLTAVTAAMTGGMIEVKDRVAASIVTGAALLVLAAVISTVVFVFVRGYKPLLHPNFFLHDMAGVGPRDSFDRGGILHAIVGSFIELGIALAITLPLGIGTAVFMTEVGGRFARVVRTLVEAMTALPSIVAGLFIYSVLIRALHYPSSGLAASLAISVMMLPIIARASDVVLRVVPGGLREASLALGASRWRTVWCVVLPTARPGLATAVILGVARGVGETSPVLLTSGASSFLVVDPTHGVMNSLPLFIYSNVRSGEPASISRAFAAASVLLILVLAFFVLARLLARPRGNRRSLRSRLAPRSGWKARGLDLDRANPLAEMGPVTPADQNTSPYPPSSTQEIP